MRYNVEQVTENIKGYLRMHLKAGYNVTIELPEKAETGHYTIVLRHEKSLSNTSWNLDRSVHRNRIMSEIAKEFPEFLHLCRNQRLNELGI